MLFLRSPVMLIFDKVFIIIIMYVEKGKIPVEIWEYENFYILYCL